MRARGMLLTGALCAAVWGFGARAGAAPAEATATTQTSEVPKQSEKLTLRQNIAWQIALERSGFSAGIIDGKMGRKAQLALSEFQRAHGLTVTGAPDDATAEALGVNFDESTVDYEVQPEDTDSVTGPIEGWIERSQAKCIGYRDLTEALAEKFHCSTGLLTSLNSRGLLKYLDVGEFVTVPAIQPPDAPKVARLEINLAEQAIRCFGEDGTALALFHCSIGKDVEHRPVGELKVVNIALNPEYLFDPKYWPEVKDVDRRLIIPPGPRNPVGLCWIALDRPGYGMHGTPTPEMIGKTKSHGCFRLTNWDAQRLAKMVKIGMPVDVVTGEPPSDGNSGFTTKDTKDDNEQN